MSGIKTSCQKCIFSEKNESGIQIGCSLGRLKYFINKNRATIDNSGTYYIINGLCVTCRANDQFSITPEAMRKSLEISNTVIINGFENDNFWPTLKKLLNQTLMPTKVIVCVKKIDKQFIEKYKEYQKYFNDKNSNLLIKKFFDKNCSFYDAVNECAMKCNTQFYTILDADSELRNDYFEKIDILYNDKMEPVVAILSGQEYVNTFALALHFAYNGNDKITLLEKVLATPEERIEKGNIWTESTL